MNERDENIHIIKWMKWKSNTRIVFDNSFHYDSLRFVDYSNNRVINCFHSIIKYQNNKMRFLFHSAHSHSDPLYFITSYLTLYHQSKYSLRHAIWTQYFFGLIAFFFPLGLRFGNHGPFKDLLDLRVPLCYLLLQFWSTMVPSSSAPAPPPPAPPLYH